MKVSVRFPPVFFRFGAVLFLPVALLVFQFFSFNVLQDDAFISFRYVRNFLDGFGLVFNLGERVEGYTNFFWIILLAILSKLGLPLIATARWAGVLAAVGTLGVCIYAARRQNSEEGWLWMIAVPFLLAANGALAYWAGSGLETGLFTLLVAAGGVAYFYRPIFSLPLIVLATLTRPEGGGLALLFGISGIILKERSWRETLTFWGALALLLLPFAVFKYSYYGSLLPNPFYAKTGFSVEYLQSGLAYVWLFLKHYGGFGLFILLPILFWRKLSAFSRFCFLIFAGYGLYVLSVGGDVLQAHRFFVPILVFFYFPVLDSIHHLLPDRWYKTPVFAAILLLTGLYGYRLPHSYLKTTGYLQTASVVNMSRAARFFDKDKSVHTVATTGIGALSYYLMGRKTIDMLGLIDTMVAKHPEKIEGLASTWKERHFNARHTLAQKPDVILFSTGVKPSALAERALFLYADFCRNYRPEFLCQEGSVDAYYRRFQNLPSAGRPDRPAAFANHINEGINLVSEGNSRRGLVALNKALNQGAKDCSILYIFLGKAYADIGEARSSEICLRKALELDGGGSISRYYYSRFLRVQGRLAEAAFQDSLFGLTMPNAAEFLETFEKGR